MNTRITKKLLAVLTAGMMILMMASLAFAAHAAGYDVTDATRFVFTNDSVTATDGAYTGYKIKGTALTINEAGTYVVSGSCENGSIVIKKNVTGVTLVLENLTLSASATAPITCNKGSGVTIVAAAGSVNNLSDDKYNNDDVYTDETLYPDIENAVIKCKDGSNVTIAGTGTINVTAYGKNGVKGGADLYEEDEDGNATDVLLSTASLTIRDVTLNVEISHSYKDPEDPSAYDGDAIKSEKELNILSGTVTVSANDDGIKCDYVLNIGEEGTDGPTIKVTKAAEGIEGAVVNVFSGSVYVTATDDGINAANGDIAERSADFSYNQYGGYVWVNVTNGDGVDSNGSASLTGGTLEVYAPSQGDGDPIDTEFGCTFGGATVLAVGHAMMQQSYAGTYVAFGGSAGRGGFGGTGTNLVTAGGAITVADANGSVLYSGSAVRDASYVLFASPSLTAGGTYTLNGSSSATAGTSNGNQGGFPGGQGGDQPGFPGEGGDQPGFPGGQGGDQPGFPGEGGDRPGFPGGAPGEFLLGDIDGDGAVTAADARIALRISVGLEIVEVFSPSYMAADVDRSGLITAADARLILRAAVGLETLQPTR